MKPSEVIDKALTKYLPDAAHWVQGAYTNAHDGCCISGAIGLVIEGDAILGMVNLLGYRAMAAIVESVNELHSARWPTSYARVEGIIVGYNDEDGRTYDEVRAVMEKARAGLQERGE